ncbi:MAG: extracellular solute-binding protein [Methylobacteriaceae bacterium]|nr:extracellular solute-binding protein [Methylobacteriaceae bacterium]MBV9221847.1 extracellular solute-binding protein [Methylobacteriaceae bacterium]
MRRTGYGTSSSGGTRRDFLRNAGFAGIGAAAGLSYPGSSGSPARAAALEGPVNAFTWGGRIMQKEVADFEQETGVHLNFIGASGNSENLAKVKLGGGDQYDIVGVDALWVPKFYEEGVIEVFDMASWPQYGDMFDQFKNLSIWKVGDKFMAQPWAWSPLVLWYNTNHIKTPPTSIKFLWDPALRQRISFTRQQEDVIAWMGIATGAKKPYAMTKEELANAKDALKRLMPNVLKFPPQEEELVKLMADESIWVTALSAGGALRIKDAGGPDCKGFLPPEGFIGYFDGDCIVKGAAHREAALAWLQHRVQAKYIIDNFMKYRRPLAYRGPLDLLQKQGKSDYAHQLFYDQPEILSKMVIIGPPPNIGEYVDAFNEVAGS